MIVLFQYPGGDGLSSISPPCVKVELALRRVGADYRVDNVSSPARARRLSRTGRLPVLEIDGERVVDSIAILDRIETAFPEAGLHPNDPQRRVRDRLWEHFATESLYWTGFYLRWVHPEDAPRFFDATFGRMSWVTRTAVRATFIPGQRRRAWMYGVGGKSPAEVARDMRRGMDMVVTGLEGGPFLQGRDRPGRGDLACAAILAQAGFLDTMPDTMAEVRARPALIEHVVRVFDACGLSPPRWLGR